MKAIRLTLCLLAAVSGLRADDDFTFFVRQIQMPDEAAWDVTVAQSGSQLSPLAINPNGARFELWTVKTSPLTTIPLPPIALLRRPPIRSRLPSRAAFRPLSCCAVRWRTAGNTLSRPSTRLASSAPRTPGASPSSI